MRTGPKHGNLLGIKISSTSRERLLKAVRQKLKTKEKFYIVTPNPEIVLLASHDWLLKKAIVKSDFSVPDGVGIKKAFKYLHGIDLEIIKGRVLFWDLIKLADEMGLKVYFLGGEKGEAEKAKQEILKKYSNIKIQTNIKMPKIGLNGQPVTKEDIQLHKSLVSGIKMFNPDLIFVGLGAPKQEKWIFRNFFRLQATGAMAVGGTFNYVAGLMKLPPKWVEEADLEWLWRFLQEPKRIRRIINAVIIFPISVFLFKNFGYLKPKSEKR